MKRNTTKNRGGAMMFMSGASSLALVTAVAMTLAAPVHAQDAAATTAAPAAEEATDVIVVGVRKSLKTAQQTKKDSDTVIDSISATDIGAFPDKSVAEALQRVPGITVERFATKGDTSHQTGEPSGVLIRGLTQVRSEFNGRDSFSANAYRGLSWSDVTPELMAGVDIYKNQTADLIEGGVAGSINLRTRTAFDSKGPVLAISVDASRGDLAKKWDPDASFLVSNRWDTSLGEFGLMLNAATSTTNTASDGLAFGQTAKFDKSVYGTKGTAYIPGGAYLHTSDYTRDRTGAAFAGNWQNHDHTMQATLQYNLSDYTTTTKEVATSMFFVANAYGDNPRHIDTSTNRTFAAQGSSPFVFNSTGDFVSGTFAENAVDAYAGNVGDPFPRNQEGDLFLPQCYSWNGCHLPDPGKSSQVTVQGVADVAHDHTADTSFHFRWDVSDRLRLDFDLQHVDARADDVNTTMETLSYGQVSLDMSGKLPKLNVKDTGLENIKVAKGGLSNLNNYFPRDMSDFLHDNSAKEDAVRIDGKYNIGTTWLDSLQVGVRASERTQDVRITAYNWANIANNWSANGAVYNADKPVYPAGYFNELNYGGNFFGGDVINNLTVQAPNVDALANYSQLKKDWSQEALYAKAATLGFTPDQLAALNVFTWNPICSNRGARAGEVYTGTVGCYKPSEIISVDEKTSAIYGKLNFGGGEAMLFGRPVSGNVGLRIVRTQDLSDGAITYPELTTGDKACPPVDPNQPSDPTSPNFVKASGCYLTAEDLKFNDHGADLVSDGADHTDYLPSFNVKLKLNDTWQARIAYSKGLSRPDIGLQRNITTYSRTLDYTRNNPDIVLGADGQPKAGAQLPFLYTVNRGNSHLLPVTADSWDLTAENYFAAVGTVSFDLFYKQFHNYIEWGQTVADVTHNGVTRQATFHQPVNAKGGSLQGVEFAFTRYLDFLPGAWSGLGFQGNVTLVQDFGINTTNLRADTQGADPSTGGAAIAAIQPFALEGISRTSYNLTAMYDKGPFALRAAYSWRDRYLLANTDANNKYPVWNEDQGFLDASVHYKVSDHVEIQLDGSNLLGTKTILTQQVEDGGNASTGAGASKDGRVWQPYAYSIVDKRVQIGIRFKY